MKNVRCTKPNQKKCCCLAPVSDDRVPVWSVDLDVLATMPPTKLMPATECVVGVGGRVFTKNNRGLAKPHGRWIENRGGLLLVLLGCESLLLARRFMVNPLRLLCRYELINMRNKTSLIPSWLIWQRLHQHLFRSQIDELQPEIGTMMQIGSSNSDRHADSTFDTSGHAYDDWNRVHQHQA